MVEEEGKRRENRRVTFFRSNASSPSASGGVSVILGMAVDYHSFWPRSASALGRPPRGLARTWAWVSLHLCLARWCGGPAGELDCTCPCTAVAQGHDGFSEVIHQKPEGPCSLSTVSSSRPESLLFLPYWSAAGLAVDWGVTYHPASFPSFCKLHCLVGAVRSLDERDLFVFPF